MQELIKLNEKPWEGLGINYKQVPTCSEEIIKMAKMDWAVSALPVHTDIHDRVQNWHAIFREDNSDVFGLVNRARPAIVQNIDTFRTFDKLLGNEIQFETAASLGHGEFVAGYFKLNQDFKLFDDKLEHYFIIVNDHLKPDGKVTILNTPVRVVCKNILSSALPAASYKIRVTISDDVIYNQDMAKRVLGSSQDAVAALSARAEKMRKHKISREDIDIILDELFPMIKVAGEDSTYSKQNQNMEIARETFINECLEADDLQNYKGTFFQVFNAVTDYSQHVFKNADKAFDLDHRMKSIQGIYVDTTALMLTKLLKMETSLTA